MTDAAVIALSRMLVDATIQGYRGIGWERVEDPIDPEGDDAVELTGALARRILEPGSRLFARNETSLLIVPGDGEPEEFDTDELALYWTAIGCTARDV